MKAIAEQEYRDDYGDYIMLSLFYKDENHYMVEKVVFPKAEGQEERISTVDVWFSNPLNRVADFTGGIKIDGQTRIPEDIAEFLTSNGLRVDKEKFCYPKR